MVDTDWKILDEASKLSKYSLPGKIPWMKSLVAPSLFMV